MTRFQLNIKCTPLTHPFPKEPGSAHDIWADFRIDIRDSDGRLVRKIFQAQWDIRGFLEWISENKDHFLKDVIPIEIPQNETSIAKVLHEYLEGIDGDTEDMELSEKMYVYGTRHGIWAGMRGYTVPDAYLGVINNKGTMSYYGNKRDNWVYEISIADFISQAIKIHENVIGKI